MFVLNPNCIPKDKGFYYSCPWIEHGIVFFPSKLSMCCFCGSIGGEYTILQENFTGNNFDIDRIFKLKNKFRRLHKQGKIYTNCNNCPSLKYEAWDERNYIDSIYISHWTACNSNCIYCYSANHPDEFKNNGYKLINLIKELTQKGILKRDSKVLFGGGEPALLDEFDDIINYLLDSGFQDIRVHSSGINYIPCLQRGLTEGKIHLTISVDAGSKEVYEKIKKIDAYERVRENIRTYSVFRMKNGESNVSAKYIIIPGVNDTKEEIEKWLIANKDDGLSYTILDIEENWYLEHKDNIPEKIYELLKYAKKRSLELNTHFELYERIESIID